MGIISDLSNLYGQIAGGRKRRQAEGSMRDAIAQLARQRLLDPEQALQFLGLADKSAYEAIDPRMARLAEESTQRLADRGAAIGLDVQAKQSLAEATRRAGQLSRGARESVLQEFRQRGGQQGSMAALGAALGGAQQSYQDAASAQGQAASAAEQRKLESQVLAARSAQQQQQIQQQAAEAQDRLRRFNVQAKQGLLTGQSNALANLAGGYTNLGQMQSGHAKPTQQMYAGAGASAENIGNSAAQMATGTDWMKALGLG